MLNEIKTKRLLRDRIVSLKYAINSSRVYLPSKLTKFVFLCGANKSFQEISERRRALIDFAKEHLPHTHFFLAEKIFHTLREEGHKENILDVEHLISDFADYILIVLESSSAFAELGAFSHRELRNKLIVINSIEYKNQNSFINLGPIKAIEESVGAERIIYYKMDPDGINYLDSIGDVFFQVYQIFKEPLRSRGYPVSLDVLNPARRCDKNSAMFIHDLIFLSGPILYKEIIEVLKLIFGEESFDNIKHLLAILTSFDSIERNILGLYRSRLHETYFDYRFDVENLIATFRNYTLKLYPKRIYE